MENEVKLANDSLSSFTFHGILDHEKQDYSLHLFEDIHCTDISFRRTDFSFSSFRDCDFKNSIFDRADFLNASFLHVSFQESDFGNALFQNCIFGDAYFWDVHFKTKIGVLSLIIAILSNADSLISTIRVR